MNAPSELEILKNEVFEDRRDNNRDKIILGYLVYAMLNTLLLFLLNQVFPDWYSGITAKVLYSFFSLGWYVLPLLLAYQIKNLRFRKIGIPMATVYLIVKVGLEIFSFFDAYNM